jgi:hypothetical protein
MEDFVNFELAQRLKEKGFREKCLAYYSKDSDFYYNTSYCSDVEYAFKSFNSRPNHICGKRIDAPTISQVLKWLREEKGIHVCIALGEFSDWMYDVARIDGNMFCKAEDDFKSYEQATLAGIEYVLDNLI